MNIEDWIHFNFSPVPKVMFERAYKRKVFRNLFKSIGETSNALSNATNVMYMILNYKTVKCLLNLKKGSPDFKIFKTSDDTYFLQFTNYNLDVMQNNWIPLYQFLNEIQNQANGNETKSVVFNQEKEEPKSATITTRKRRTTTTQKEKSANE